MPTVLVDGDSSLRWLVDLSTPVVSSALLPARDAALLVDQPVAGSW